MIRCAVCKIYVNNEVLLLQRHNHDRTTSGWCLPGGKIDDHERIIDGIEREVMEETGIDASNLLTYNGQYQSEVKGEPALIHVYSMDLYKKPEVELSDEHQGYEWVCLTTIDDHEDLAGNTIRAFKVY